jgi:hypothetical protein|tara:strand:- start:410 stop:532 length:123 start_codon:yes stop_codon:yes gene_type:complete
VLNTELDIRRVECEKTGTIYYENIKTKETAWIKSAFIHEK